MYIKIPSFPYSLPLPALGKKKIVSVLASFLPPSKRLGWGKGAGGPGAEHGRPQPDLGFPGGLPGLRQVKGRLR